MRRDLLVLCLLCGVTFFAGLGRPAITDSDEAFYAEAGREMIESGDWLTPHYNYEFRFEKPVLFYWLIAGAYLVGGVTSAAARLPAALAGLCLTLITYVCARRLYDAPTGRLAAAIVATSFGYFTMARLSLPDLPLALFVTCTVWAVLKAVPVPSRLDNPGAGSTEQQHTGESRRWLVVAAAAAAAATLTKGPVGIALPVVILLFVFVRERPPLPRGPDLIIACCVFVALAAPWYVAMTYTHGASYLRNFFVGENLERFATERFNDPRPFWFYVPIVFGGMLPWSPFVALWGPALSRIATRRRPLVATEWRLVAWAAAPLLFFSLSVGKQPRYILPVLPPLAILLARSMTRRLARTSDQSGSLRDRLFAVSGVLSGTALVALGLLLYRASPLLPHLTSWQLMCAVAVIALSGLGVIVLTLSRKSRLVPAALTLGAATTLLALQYSLFSTNDPAPVERMAELVRATRGTSTALGTYHAFVRNLIFYTHLKQTDLPGANPLAAFLRSDSPVLCVIAEDELKRILQAQEVSVRRLGDVFYFNTANVKLRTLLQPDPARDLETVVLVANKQATP